MKIRPAAVLALGIATIFITALLVTPGRVVRVSASELVAPQQTDPVRIWNTINALSTLSDGTTPRSRFTFHPDMDSIGVWLETRLAEALAPAGARASTARIGFNAEPDTCQTCGNCVKGGIWNGSVPHRTTLYDIVGTLRGNGSAPGKFLVTSHYDATACRTPAWRASAGPAPGADDNASGTAAVLELARLLSQDNPYEFDIEFVMFDGEEQGLLGSTMLAELYKSRGDQIMGVLNMDMIGYNSRVDSLVVMTNRSSNYLAHYMIDTETLDPQPNFTFVPEIANLAYSDHWPFWERDYPAILLIENVGIVLHNPNYHRVTDTTAGGVSRQGILVAKSANIILKSLRRLAAAASGPPKLHMSDADVFASVSRVTTPIAAIPGDSVRVLAGAFNIGGSFPAGYSQEIRIYRLTDSGRELLASKDVTAPFLNGAHTTLDYTFVPTVADAGAITLEAETGEGASLEKARITVAVRAGRDRVVRNYVAPNPVRNPSTASLYYELSNDESARITFLDLHGDVVGRKLYTLGETDTPGTGLSAGLNKVPLADILYDTDMAPGIYLYQIEIFNENGQAGDTGTGKFAIVR